VLVDGIGRRRGREAALPSIEAAAHARPRRGVDRVRRLRPRRTRSPGGGRLSVDGLPTGSTRVLGIIGDPIAQARSPEVWSALFRLNGVDAVCVPMQVDPSRARRVPRGREGAPQLPRADRDDPHKAASLEHVAR
jgi:hypothetical protein